jgi:hypothetical protein
MTITCPCGFIGSEKDFDLNTLTDECECPKCGRYFIAEYDDDDQDNEES